MLCLPLILALSTPSLAGPTRGDGGERKPPEEVEQPAPRGGEADRTPPKKKKPAEEPAEERKKKKKKKKGGFKIDRVNPFYGTLVYGPKPGSHSKYAGAQSKKKPTTVAKKDMPERKVDHKQTMAFGLRGGGYFYGDSGEAFADPGAGGAFRWRPFEAVGIQLDLSHHADSFPGAERANTLFGGAGQIFLFPWKGVSPFLSVGAVQNFRGGGGLTQVAPIFGAQGGLGLQLSMSQAFAFELEGRVIGWTNREPNDTTQPTAGQLTGGLMLHF